MQVASLLVIASSLAAGQTFEVASVRSSPPVPPQGGVYLGPPRGGPGTPDPGQITWSYAQMKALLMRAFDVKNYQIDGPAWLDAERYDIAVKLPSDAAPGQLPAMWRNLLVERFGLKVHRIQREFQVEELTVARGGAKLKETSLDLSAPLPPGPPESKNGNLLTPGQVTAVFFANTGPNARTTGKAQTLDPLTAMLSSTLGKPVLDKTGLTGKYDYSIEYRMDLSRLPPPPGAAPAPAPSPGDAEPAPDLVQAVQQQLGLKLTPAKAMLDVFVIDALEKAPSGN